jgi:hypothetical protein
MVQAISLAGSGPSLRPCRASRALVCRTDADAQAFIGDDYVLEPFARIDQDAA